MWRKNIFLILLGIASLANAEEPQSLYQAHFRTGMLSASFSGAGQTSGSFSIPNTLDAEMEFFRSTRRAFTVRAMMAMDMSQSKVRYTYGGVGQRFYFKRPGLVVSRFDSGSTFIATPKLRYYGGWDAGIAQVLVLEFGDVLSTFSTILEVGGNAGAIYQMTKNFGMEAHVGMAYGFGFSSVTVSGMAMRIFLGGSYFF